MKHILISVTFLFLTIPAFGQIANAQPCTLKASQAPPVRGVRLDMMADELFPLFSSSTEDSARIKQSLTAVEGYPHFGYAYFGLNLSDFANREQVAGINYLSVGLFDRRVVSLTVQYERFPKGANWKNTDDLIQKFSDAFHLPGPNEWVNDPGQGRKILRCNGFEVTVSSGDPASIAFVNRDWVQTQKDRTAAFEEQRRRDFKP